MAIVTLPNGAEYNTGLPFDEQPDGEKTEQFIDQIQTANTASKITISGQDPSLSRPTSYTWTETSYTGSNYIWKQSVSYINDTYKVRGTSFEFKIEDK